MSNLRPDMGAIRARFATNDYEAVGPTEHSAKGKQEATAQHESQPQDPPTAIANLIARRAGARETFADTPQPAPGHFVRIDAKLVAGAGFDFSEPIAVLLDTLTQDQRSWNGWLVGRDPHMASVWDLIVGPEEDTRDPLCEIVQCWNPVVVPANAIATTLAMLGPPRLHAARMLSADHSANQGAGTIPTPLNDHRPGIEWARRLSDGTGVVTGTVLGDADPRTEYQRLYRGLAASVTRQATQAAGSTPQAPLSWRQRMLDRLAEWRHAGFVQWRPVALVVVLVIVPLLVLNVTQDRRGTGTDLEGKDLYLGQGAMQTLSVSDPERAMRDLDERFRSLGILADIHSYPDGTGYVLQADVGTVTVDDWTQLERTWSIQRPQGGKLRLLILETAATKQDGGEEKKP